MIKFFRKIRQKLIEENRIRKYLFYAIGEIILVVIGILIALQINNWNEERKSKILELTYLERLKSDLASDTVYFNRRLNDAIAISNNGDLFIKKMYKTQNDFDEYIDLMDTYLWESEQFVAQRSTFNELNNSGQLNLISNEVLKKTILDHYLRYEEIENHILEVNEFSVREMSKIISIKFKGSNISNRLKGTNIQAEMEWQFINAPQSQKFIELESAAAIYSEKHLLFKKYFLELLNDSRILISEINEELISNN